MLAATLAKIYKKRKIDFLLTIAGLAIVLSILFIALLAPYITPYDPYISVDEALLPPSPKHIMGTDNLGRDVYSRILYGSRTVIIVVLTSTLVSLVVGSTLGLVSGYFGGKVDRALSIVMDSLYSFPGLILA
ncbi:MAG: ABC transporter permease, partial [Thermoprotei archaeon]